MLKGSTKKIWDAGEKNLTGLLYFSSVVFVVLECRPLLAFVLVYTRHKKHTFYGEKVSAWVICKEK